MSPKTNSKEFQGLSAPGKTLDMEIFIITRNGDTKIMQHIVTMTPHKNKEKKLILPVQMNIYNTYKVTLIKKTKKWWKGLKTWPKIPKTYICEKDQLWLAPSLLKANTILPTSIKRSATEQEYLKPYWKSERKTLLEVINKPIIQKSLEDFNNNRKKNSLVAVFSYRPLSNILRGLEGPDCFFPLYVRYFHSNLHGPYSRVHYQQYWENSGLLMKTAVWR